MTDTKKGLGQGLAAILGGNQQSTINEETSTMDPDRLMASRFQPRQNFRSEEIIELAESIKINGMLQPIIIRPTETGKYEILAGERRWRAALSIHLRQVPVIIKEVTDEQSQTIALVENVQRTDLNVMEEAEGYQRLVTELNYTQEKVAEMVSKSRSHVANILRLNTLPERVKKYIHTGHLSFGHAKALIGFENAATIVEFIIAKQLSVRQTEKLIKKIKKQNESPEKDITKLALEIIESGHSGDDQQLENVKEYTAECKSIENLIHTYNPRLYAQVKIINNQPQIKLIFKNFQDLDEFLEKLTS